MAKVTIDNTFTPLVHNPENVLEVNQLKKYFPIKEGLLQRTVGYVRAVDGISFNIKRGTTMGLVGESGCGKTTVGRTILHLYKPTAGEIYYHGRKIVTKDDIKAFRQKASMVFQDPYSSLNPRMTVADIIGEPLDVHKLYSSKKERQDRILELMSYVGLNSEHAARYAHEFSGGQRQRIGIARALAVNPDFVVCDEPVSALDVSIQAQVINLFRRLQKQFNLTYVFISHDLGIIKYISDRIMIMYLGRVMEFYTSEGIYADPKHPYTKALLSAIPPESPFDKKERLPLTGDIPSPIGDQVGCPLAGRCPHCTDRCKKEIPKLVDTGDGHMVACFLYE